MVLILVAVSLLAGGACPRPPGPSRPKPGGGDIIIDRTGWKLGVRTLTQVQDDELWIPSGFTGKVFSIIYDRGDRRTPVKLEELELHFPRGGVLKLVPGDPHATWTCRSGRSAKWKPCTVKPDDGTYPSSMAVGVGSDYATFGRYRLDRGRLIIR